MPTKTPVAKTDELLRPKLEESYDPQSLIALVPIHNNQHVADVGSGPGWLSLPLAKYLYAGKLYAVDVQAAMLDKVREQADRYHIGNIETRQSKESTIPLDDGSMDGVVLSNTLNEATRPRSLLKECARLLRNGGWMAVVEWLQSDHEPEFGPPAAQRIPMEQLLEMGGELGLHRIRSRQIGPSHYVVLFKK
jgi:ubiquinone/menaquinone biosynthesis C-methylase UbiE